MSPDHQNRRSWTIRKPLGIGIFSVVFLFAVLVVWGMKINIAGAVIAKGKVQASSTRTVLQHPVGGVVVEVLAQNGNFVKAGDVVLRLDDTQLRSELKIVEGELFEILSKSARLEAIIDDRPELLLHPVLRLVSNDEPQINDLLDRQQRRLESHYASLDTKKRLLGQQIKQVEKQIAGVEAELDAKKQRSIFVEKELKKATSNFQKGLIRVSVVNAHQIDQYTTRGEIGKLSAKIAELTGKIAELGLNLHALTPSLKEKASEKLDTLGPLKTKFLEQRNRLMDALSKLEIRTPISGTIHDSKVLGLRSVVVSAKPLMYIVPDDDPASVAVRVDAADIDQVFIGQNASLKFSAFNRRSTPTIIGQVTNISADAFLDEKTQKLYYFVELFLPATEIEKLGKNTLISGMPVSAFITTQSRSPLNYLTKPIMDYFDRAFRDS